MKKFLTNLIVVLFVGYLAMAFTLLNRPPKDVVCPKMEIVFQKKELKFISVDEITEILKQKKLYPAGENWSKISTEKIENALKGNPLIERCECYKTSQNNLRVNITGREPVLHVFPAKGKEYYVDRNGKTMPHVNCAIYLPVATGYIDKDFATRQLYELTLYLQSDKFWDAQIEQIHVTGKGEVELIPRVGNHIIRIGKAVEVEQKLERLAKFYTKGLNVVGWNKYSIINLEFNNQIICTKK